MKRRTAVLLSAVASSALLAGGVATASPASAALRTCVNQNVTYYNANWGKAKIPADSSNNENCVMSSPLVNTGVKALQSTLTVCYGKGLQIDGDFGKATKSALISVQKQINVVADGIYGPNTRDALKWPYYPTGSVIPTCH